MAMHRPLPCCVVILFLFCAIPSQHAQAGDPQVRTFVQAPLTVQVGDTVRFTVEMVNPFAFPASNFQSRFIITPLTDTAKTERFDVPPFVFPPMATVNVGMDPQFWIPSVPGPHRVYFQSFSPDDIDPLNNFIEHDFVVQPSLLERPEIEYILNSYLHSAPVAATHLMLLRFTDDTTRVQSRWTNELDTTLTGPAVVAWVLEGWQDRYYAGDRVLILDRRDSTRLSDTRISVDPLMNISSYVPIPGDLRGADIISGSPPEVHQVMSLEHLSNPDSTSAAIGKALAILVSGRTREGWSQDESFAADAYRLQRELYYEGLGPRPLQDDITILHSPTPQQVRTELQSATTGYSSLYFYYSGFGSTDAMMLADPYPYEEFLDDLAGVDVDSINILIDASHAGTLPVLLDQARDRFRGTHITAVTATSIDTRSTWCEYRDAAGDTLALGTFSYEFSRAFGNPLADVDGIPGTSFAETFDFLRGENPLLPWSNEALFDVLRPQLYVKPIDSLALLLDRPATELALKAYIPTQGGVDPARAALYLPQLPYHGVLMEGPAESGISIPLDSLHWPAVLIHDKYAIPASQTTYFLLDRRDGTIIHINTDWLPLIDQLPYPASATQAVNDIILGTERVADRISSLNTVSQPAPMPPSNPRAATVILGGGGGGGSQHHRFEDVPQAITAITRDFLEEANRTSTVGDILSTLPTAAPSVVRDTLQKLRNRVDMLSSIYFGAGRDSAMVGNGEYGYREYINDLREIDAESIEILIDAPSAGSAVRCVLESIPSPRERQLTLLTSSAQGYPAYSEFLVDDAGDSLSIPSFTWSFLHSHGNPDANIDGIPGTSFAEIYYHLHKTAPRFGWFNARVFDLQQPDLFIRGRRPVIADDLSIPDADITLRFESRPRPGAMFEYIQRMHAGPNSDDSVVIYISPTRIWSLDITGDTSAFLADLTFRYRPDFDSTRPPSHARLGLVRRVDGDTTSVAGYRYWPRSFWDRQAGTVTARDVPAFSDWALAYVRNSAPSSFARIGPLDDTAVFEDSIVVRWSRANDDNGDSLVYILDVTADGGTRRSIVTDSMLVVRRGDLGLPAGVFTVTWQLWCTDGTDTTAAANGVGRFTFDVSTAVDDVTPRPETLHVLGHHPEPATGAVRLSLQLHAVTPLRVTISSLLGEMIATVADGIFDNGIHTFEWNGRSSSGHALPSGVYLAVFEIPGTALVTHRLTVLR